MRSRRRLRKRKRWPEKGPVRGSPNHALKSVETFSHIRWFGAKENSHRSGKLSKHQWSPRPLIAPAALIATWSKSPVDRAFKPNHTPLASSVDGGRDRLIDTGKKSAATSLARALPIVTIPTAAWRAAGRIHFPQAFPPVVEPSGIDTYLSAELGEWDRRRLLADNEPAPPLDPRFCFEGNLLARMIYLPVPHACGPGSSYHARIGWFRRTVTLHQEELPHLIALPTHAYDVAPVIVAG